MFGASETPYDLRFRLMGIPVRVHPIFWLVSAVLGWQERHLERVAIWVACVFVSILVHEFGHALTAKLFGSSPAVLLYGMGGLCYYEGDRQTPLQRLGVVLMGPGAGFILCFLVTIFASALYSLTPGEHLSVIEALIGITPQSMDLFSATEKLGGIGNNGFFIYYSLVYINLMWGLVNLLPIWPLDGGRICEILLSLYNPSQGRRWTHIISLVVAGMVAVMVATRTNDLFLILFFAYFAVINYQVLQSIQHAQMMGLYQDDDWWRR